MTTTTEAQVLEHIAASPAGQRAIAEIEAERLERRRAAAGSLAVLEAAHGEDVTRLNGAREKALVGVRVAEQKVATAVTKYQEAELACSSASNTYNAAKGKLEFELLSTASPLITAFLHELVETADEARRSLSVVEGERHWLTRRRGESATNSASVRATLEAITTGRLEAEALRLEALDDAAVEQRLASLRATIQDAWGGGN